VGAATTRCYATTMGLGSALVLATGLAMDAAAVAATRGMVGSDARARDVAWLAGSFGVFQALMPLLGHSLGARLGDAWRAWDHWVAFLLLGGLGLKMLREAWVGGDEVAAARAGFAPRTVLPLALATSIDAFAAGLLLPLLDFPIAASALVIGVVTAALSVFGFAAGRRFGALVGRRFEALGGLVLLALGAKILVEHLRSGV
jgi:manganese efflux pump family protein